MRGKLYTALGVVLTLALVGGMAAAPALWFSRRDAALMARPVERLRLTGRLSPEGEDLYLVRTLHARDDLRRRQGAAADYQPQDDPLEGQSRTLLAMDDMTKAGALPPQLRSLVQSQLGLPGAQWRYSVDGAGFEQVQCLLPQGSQFSYFGVELEPRTRMVVRLWLSLPMGAETPSALADMDGAACLAAYRQWLGLDGLDDWETPQNAAYPVQQCSQKGLLQLYLDGENGLAMGAATLAAAPEGDASSSGG